MKEISNKEPDGGGDKYVEGQEYNLPSDGLHPRAVFKDARGGIDTVQYGGNKNGKLIDTIIQKH